MITMKTITATKAGSCLHVLIENIAKTGIPIRIRGERSNAILLSENDWQGIQETLCLLSIPNMRESIKKGLETPLDECSDEIE